MYLKIDEITIHKQTNGLYVLIRFWPDKAAHDRSDPAEVTNDFTISGVRPTAMRIVTNAEGWWKRLSDGVFIDPKTIGSFDETEWERESYDVDLPAIIKDAAKAYYGRFTAAKLSAKPYPKNHTDPRIVKTATDPENLLRADVVTMVGEGYEIAVVEP